MMTAGSEPRPLLIVAHCLLLVTLGARVVSSAEEVAPTLRRTFSDEELVNFCSTRHTGAQAVKPHGYIHPIYCSRFIMCAKLKSAEGKDQISAEEKICPRCPESVTKLANDPNQPSKNRSSAVCKFGHLHFDEESQVTLYISLIILNSRTASSQVKLFVRISTYRRVDPKNGNAFRTSCRATMFGAGRISAPSVSMFRLEALKHLRIHIIAENM